MKMKKQNKLKPYYCEECEISFQHSSSLSRHRASKHKQQILEDNVVHIGGAFICDACERPFRRKDTLIRHIFSRRQCTKNTFDFIDLTCAVCSRKFSRKCSLIYHMQRQHIPINEKNYYECAYCNKKYSRKFLLSSHIQRQHLTSNGKARIRKVNPFVCVLCGKDFTNEINILDHFRSTHQVTIEEDNLYFNSMEDFKSWLKIVEKETWCSYIKEYNTLWYQCHRSGFYMPTTERKRQASKKGSKKINGYCPSRVRVVKNNDGSCNVRFIKTHVGHSISPDELVHVRFSAEQKIEISGKLLAGVSISEIMKDLQKKRNTSGEYVEKDLLITRRDVRNFASSQHLRHISRKLFTEVLDVESYVSKNKDSVLFFKRQGESDTDNLLLDQGDFLLIIMKPRQFQCLMNYGTKVIALDSTPDENPQDFLLHTILVMDENNEGCPCCFLITNRHDQVAIDVMFSCVKKKCGEIKTRCFMSDIKETYFNSWLRIMNNKPQFRLFCPWLVERAWNANIRKIMKKDKRDLVKGLLQDLYNESNFDGFYKKLSTFLDTEDDAIQKFVVYFRTHFQNNAEQWAFCYKQHVNIDTNMSITRFHRKIKYSRTGFNLEQVKYCLHVLDSFVESKRDRKSKTTNKAIATLSKVTLNEEGDHIIESFNDELTSYIITEDEKPVRNFYETASKVICNDDNTYAHSFWCSCPENSESNLCEHVHLASPKNLIEVIEVIDIQNPDDIDKIYIDTPCDEMIAENEEEIIIGENLNYDNPSCEKKTIQIIEESIDQDSEYDADLVPESECVKEMVKRFNTFISKTKIDTKEKMKRVITMFDDMSYTLSAMDELKSSLDTADSKNKEICTSKQELENILNS